MEEKILHTIWQYSLLHLKQLKTTTGKTIHILKVGSPNNDQGPDFLNAQIIIDGINWVGNIEIDLYTSSWSAHQHSKSEHFKNIILHVVWKNDLKKAPHSFPILELDSLVSMFFARSYMQQNPKPLIPCQKLLKSIPQSIWEKWINVLITERFQTKVRQFEETLQQLDYDWEQAFWISLAKQMGGKQNRQAFEELARRLPIAILYKEKINFLHIESLILGVAGILKQVNEPDEHTKKLQSLYKHLALKYNLQTINTPLSYLRMRPFQFPDFRLVQLAALIFVSNRIIELVSSPTSWKEKINSADEHITNYWKYHFRLNKKTTHPHSTTIGKMFQNVVITNVLTVALLSYQKHQPSTNNAFNFMELLRALPAEQNHITRIWKQLYIPPIKHTYHSQAYLHLYENYCKTKRCLSCQVGQYLLTNNQHK